MRLLILFVARWLCGSRVARIARRFDRRSVYLGNGHLCRDVD